MPFQLLCDGCSPSDGGCTGMASSQPKFLEHCLEVFKMGPDGPRWAALLVGRERGCFPAEVWKKKREAWWWVTASSFSMSACRGHVCLHLELITVTTSSENLDTGKSTGILPRHFPWAVRLMVQMYFFQYIVPFPPTTKFILTFSSNPGGT